MLLVRACCAVAVVEARLRGNEAMKGALAVVLGRMITGE